MSARTRHLVTIHLRRARARAGSQVGPERHGRHRLGGAHRAEGLAQRRAGPRSARSSTTTTSDSGSPARTWATWAAQAQPGRALRSRRRAARRAPRTAARRRRWQPAGPACSRRWTGRRSPYRRASRTRGARPVRLRSTGPCGSRPKGFRAVGNDVGGDAPARAAAAGSPRRRAGRRRRGRCRGRRRAGAGRGTRRCPRPPRAWARRSGAGPGSPSRDRLSDQRSAMYPPSHGRIPNSVRPAITVGGEVRRRSCWRRRGRCPRCRAWSWSLAQCSSPRACEPEGDPREPTGRWPGLVDEAVDEVPGAQVGRACQGGAEVRSAGTRAVRRGQGDARRGRSRVRPGAPSAALGRCSARSSASLRGPGRVQPGGLGCVQPDHHPVHARVQAMAGRPRHEHHGRQGQRASPTPPAARAGRRASP